MINPFPPLMDRDRRSAIIWAIGISILAYFVFITQHILGNHALRLPWLLGSEQIGNGRWLAPILGHLHYNADVPVFMPVFGILLGALSALFATAGWNLTRSRLENVVLFAMILVFPMNLAFFYYSFMTPLFFIANVFAAAAVFILSKYSLWRLFTGSVCVLLMLASYQAAVSIFGLLSLAWPVAHLLRTRQEASTGELKQQFILLVLRVLASMIGGFAYVLSLKYFHVPDSQSLEFHSLADVIARVRLVIFTAFDHLIITQPDMLAPLKRALLVVLMISILSSVVYLRKTPLRAAIVLVLWLLMIVSTKAIFLISDPTGSMYEYRYNSGIGFLHAFSFAVLFFCAQKWRVAQTVWLLVSACVLVVMIQADLVRQDILIRGQSHDLAIANRILTRIEELDNFDPAKTYDLIRIGRYSSFRYDLYRAGRWKIDRAGDGHMDFGEVTDRWVDEDVFRLLGAKIHFQQKSTDPRYSQKYAEVLESGVLDGHDVWPAKSSVFLSGDRIIVLMARPPAKPRPQNVSDALVIGDGSSLTAPFDASSWISSAGNPSSLRFKDNAITLSSGRGGLSMDALSARPGEMFKLELKGQILDRGSNGVPLSFASGPVFLDKNGKVVGWWSSQAGREAIEAAAEDGSFSYSREVAAPASATSAHIGFHGPYSPDGIPSDGSVSITSARLERLGNSEK